MATPDDVSTREAKNETAVTPQAPPEATQPVTGRTSWDFVLLALTWLLPDAGPRTMRVLRVAAWTVIVLTVGFGAWWLLKPASGATYDNHGTNNGIIGPNGTIITGAKQWPTPSDADRAELVRTLKTMAPETFFTVASPHAMRPAQQMFSDLIQGGWTPVTMKIPGATPGVVQNGGAPSVYGVRIAPKVRTPAVDYLAKWCVRVGLQSEDPVTVDTSPRDESVDINFGDPPK